MAVPGPHNENNSSDVDVVKPEGKAAASEHLVKSNRNVAAGGIGNENVAIRITGNNL